MTRRAPLPEPTTPLSIGEMLDLPSAERSTYLHRLTLTTDYVFGCLENPAQHYVRRVITAHGGIFRALYAPPGVAYIATFRTRAGMDLCSQWLCGWLNEDLLDNMPELLESDPDGMLYDVADFAHSVRDAPVMVFEEYNCIGMGPGIRTRLRHPLILRD